MRDAKSKCNGLLKKCCRIPSSGSRNTAGPQVAAGKGQRVPRAASPRQGRCMRSCSRSLKVAGPHRRVMWQWWVGKRQMDRHTMQSEDGYLLSGYGGGGGGGKEGEKSRERERERGETKAASPRGSWKRERELEAEDQLPSVDEGGSGRGLSLKETEQSLH